MRRWRSDIGQATSEYAALVTLVAVVLAGAAGLTSGGVGSGVLAGVQRALCRVAARACPRPIPVAADLAPCPLERRLRQERLSETIASLRLGSDEILSAVRGSDGRVTVALAHGSELGGEGGLGARLRIGGAAAEGALRGGAGLTWTSGRAWTLPNAAAAQRFVARFGGKATAGGKLVDEVRSRCSVLCDALGWRPHAELPQPDETYEEGGPMATLTGALGIGRVAASVDRQVAAVLGRRHARDGTTTWQLKLGSRQTAAITVPFARLSGATDAATLLSYRLDGRGRPLALSVQLTGERDGAAGGRAGEAARAGSRRGRVVELEATLDLRAAAHRAAAVALLEALRDPRHVGALPQRAKAVAEEIERDGEIDRRVFAVRSTSWGLDASASLGLAVGGGFERTTRGLQLVDATTRLPGLPFLPRDDCRPA